MSEIPIISSDQNQVIPVPKENLDPVKTNKAKTVIEAGSELEETNQELLDLEAGIEEILRTIVDKQPSANSNVLSRIMRLLIDVLPLLQQLAVAQANKLNLATDMQGLYTKLIADAPYYTKSGGAYNEDDDTKRQELNAKVDNYTSTLRAYRDQWSDTAKKDQTNINTSNEAVNQLVDQLTTFMNTCKELTSLINR